MATETIFDIIYNEWATEHSTPPGKSPRRHKAFCHKFYDIADRIREGRNEQDTMQLTSCSSLQYRRVTAAVAAE